MEQCDSLDIWKSKIERLVEGHPLQIISWEATRKCNLSCKHCGSPSENVELGEELTSDEVIGAFNQVERDFDMSGFRHVNITGESLLFEGICWRFLGRLVRVQIIGILIFRRMGLCLVGTLG